MNNTALVIVPVFNEAASVGKVIEEILNNTGVDVLAVDDNSTDGSIGIVRSFFNTGRVFMVERPAKLGLGTAYINGFQWGLHRGYGLFFEMDADYSHNPAAMPHFINKIADGYDIVVGSRYLCNTISVVGWDFKRLLLSKFGNWYASALLGIRQFTDLTSGYRCYTGNALEKIGLDKIRSNGYAFQIEMIYRAHKSGLRIAEIPIIFSERAGGGSKMNRSIVREAALLPFSLRFKKDT